MEDATEINVAESNGLPANGGVGLVPSPPLLAGLAGERGEQALGFGLRILSEVFVLQHFLGGWTLLRVQGEEAIEQRGAGGCEVRETGADDGAGGERGLFGEAQGAGVGEAAEARPGVFGGDAAELKDFGYLVDLVGPLQEWFAGDELAHDAADGPHVDGGIVGARSEEELGGAVPECDDELGEFGAGVADVAGHAEVCDLEEAAVGEEEVGCFEVAVEDVVLVEVGDA